MAVEASYFNLLPSQLLTNREIIKSNQQHHQLNSDYMFNTPMDSALPLPATMPESLLSFYQSNLCDPNKADSGLTYNIPLQRKRSRDFTTELTSLPAHQKNKISSQSPSFLNNQDFLYQFQNQPSEFDRVLAQHNEKVRMELEERKSRMLISAIQETMEKKLREKEEEIERMGKLNWALQERVKSLCVENQIWRELAQTNETTANYLRTNLEQVLAHVGEERAAAVADDAQSSCGSHDVAEAAGDDTAASASPRLCRSCGVRESVVLLLPCRHLCLCTMCGSTVRNCPICDSGMDATVHVNLS